METIRHTVRAISGHYGMPVPVRNGDVKHSFPHVPPATVRGYLESLMGLERGGFEGDIAIGVLHPANKGYGRILRKSIVRANIPGWGIIMAHRMLTWEIHYDVGYQVAVRGPMLGLLEKALRGEVERFGVLSLGTSDDEVYDITPEEREAFWVVPGKSFILPIESQDGWKNRNPKLKRFSLTTQPDMMVPEEAWIPMLRVPLPEKKGKQKTK